MPDRIRPTMSQRVKTLGWAQNGRNRIEVGTTSRQNRQGHHTLTATNT
jgi:hypothetical protein